MILLEKLRQYQNYQLERGNKFPVVQYMLHMLQRVFQVILTLVVISIITFFVISLVDARVSEPGRNFARRQADRAQHIWPQYLRWFTGMVIYPDDVVQEQAGVYRRCLYFDFWNQTICDTAGGVARANLGTSARSGLPVWTQIVERIPATLELAGAGLILGSLFGIPLGILGLRNKWSIFDHLVRVFANIGHRIPAFWVGLLFVFLYGVYQNWFPTEQQSSIRGLGNVFFPADPSLVGHLQQLIVPALFLSLLWISLLCRWLRTELFDLIRVEYVETIKGRGVKAHWRWLRASNWSSYRSSQLTLSMIAGPAIGNLLAATVIIEALSGWPGIGWLTFTSAVQRDYPVILGIVMVISMFVTLANLVNDLLHAFGYPVSVAPTGLSHSNKYSLSDNVLG